MNKEQLLLEALQNLTTHSQLNPLSMNEDYVLSYVNDEGKEVAYFIEKETGDSLLRIYEKIQQAYNKEK